MRQLRTLFVLLAVPSALLSPIASRAVAADDEDSPVRVELKFRKASLARPFLCGQTTAILLDAAGGVC